MNRKQLVSKTAEILRQRNVRKPVTTPKHKFHISDDEGNQKDFIVRQTEKSVLYNVNDVAAILDACLEAVEDSIKHGEEIQIYGFGALGVHFRAARSTIHPATGERVQVQGRYIPKFTFGSSLRMAAKLYELSLRDDQPQQPLSFGEELDEYEEADE